MSRGKVEARRGEAQSGRRPKKTTVLTAWAKAQVKAMEGVILAEDLDSSPENARRERATAVKAKAMMEREKEKGMAAVEEKQGKEELLCLEDASYVAGRISKLLVQRDTVREQAAGNKVARAEWGPTSQPGTSSMERPQAGKALLEAWWRMKAGTGNKGDRRGRCAQ